MRRILRSYASICWVFYQMSNGTDRQLTSCCSQNSRTRSANLFLRSASPISSPSNTRRRSRRLMLLGCLLLLVHMTPIPGSSSRFLHLFMLRKNKFGTGLHHCLPVSLLMIWFTKQTTSLFFYSFLPSFSSLLLSSFPPPFWSFCFRLIFSPLVQAIPEGFRLI